MPFDAYRCYLSLKNHFTKEHYDYIKYRGKTRATVQASIRGRIGFGLRRLQDRRKIKK